MADEDEIDILSEFNLDNLLQKSETEIYNHSELNSHHSNCDCSAPWSSDHTSHTLWDSNDHSDYTTELSQETLYSLPETSGLVSDIVDINGWTKTEKNLLIRGIEIFGKSSVRLAQFIGSKTSGEIKTYLKNFYSDGETVDSVHDDTVVEDNLTGGLGNFKDNVDNVILDDSEIPASIEEVITVVTTAGHTVPVRSYKSKDQVKLFKSQAQKHKNIPSNNLLLKKKMTKLFDYRNDNHGKRMFKKKSSNVDQSSKKPSHYEQMKFGGKAKCKMKVHNSVEAYLSQSVPEVNTTVNNTNVVPSINGEEVVKMKKEIISEESTSDIEVDVESLNGDDETNVKPEVSEKQNISTEESNIPQLSDLTSENSSCETQNAVIDETSSENLKVLQQLRSMEVPESESLLEDQEISDLEKYINKEFFCGRPTKTPNRYLRIRNHILSLWSISKPNYVTKTSVRAGLKNCGDVNSISRIHQLLEQIGAINFGCSQLSYVRPLSDLFVEHTPTVKEKVSTTTSIKPVVLSRPRNKRKFNNDGEGGCTFTHDEKGDVISTTVVNEEPVVKLRPYNKKPSVRLIYCKPFTDEHPQKYSIHLHLSTLLLMDFHAHISHTEVMGLIGGHWHANSKKLRIIRYVPCRNIAPSATHCDMCPISQAQAADIIHSEGLNILGWFHSHPTFAPEPSQQDLDTQFTVQQWIGISKPCVGLILSPFSAHGALIASPYRCLIVDRKHNFEDQYLPYKFKIILDSSNLDIDLLLGQAWRIYNRDCNINDNDKVDFKRPYFLDSSISYLDKFISSVKMHLAKCADINKMSCDAIIAGFSSICLNKI